MDLRNISREGWLLLAFLFFLTTQGGEFGALFLLMLILVGARAFSNSRTTGERTSTQRSSGSRSDNGRVVVSNRRGERSRARRDDDPFYDEEPQPRISRSKSADAVQPHALEAVRAAGRNPDRMAVLPVDIGVLSFKNSEEPFIIRDWDVMDDVDYVQPYVQLRLPQNATGRIRFEISDTDGELVFVHEDDYQFVRGRNLVVPSTRLPVHDEQPKNGLWKLRVKADNLLIAEHVISWADPDENPEGLRRHIVEDGEISNELRAMLAESRLEQISLDDLLADQEIDEQARQRRR